MKASIRVNSLTLGGAGSKTLHAQELHGKRLDKSSQERRVRNADPLIFGSLNLREAYDKHVAGARMNKSLKRPVLHALVQFPTDLKVTEKLEKQMLAHAMKFINQTHGGEAVFAARLDRDEDGQHTVDVFFAPKYTKVTKSKGEEVWISTSKHGKDLARKHEAKIRARHLEAKEGPLTGPRHVGIALQEELTEYLTGVGLKLEPRTEKAGSRPDRVDPETFKARQDAEADRVAAAEELERVKALRADLDKREEEIRTERAALDAEKVEIEEERSQLRELAAKLRDAIAKAMKFARRPGAPIIEQVEAMRMKKQAGPLLRDADKVSPPPEDSLDDPYGPGF